MDEAGTKEIVVDFGEICRFCLSENGELSHLFAGRDDRDDLKKKTWSMMGIKVATHDGFPPWGCESCLAQLEASYNFIEMCRHSQFTLNESYVSAIKALTVAGIEENEIQEILSQRGSFITQRFGPDTEDGDSAPVEDTNSAECNNAEEEAEGAGSGEVEETAVKVECGEPAVQGTAAGEAKCEADSTGFWTCDVCGHKFRSKISILTHIRRKHLEVEKAPAAPPGRTVACYYCGAARGNMAQHLETSHRVVRKEAVEPADLGNYDCRVCLRPFVRHSAFRTHVERVHGDDLEVIADAEDCEVVWSCPECDLLFPGEVFLIQHCGERHSKYPAEVDSQRTLKSRSLICHCGVINSNALESAVHRVLFHESSGLDCPACPRRFPSTLDLKKHLISHHLFISTNYDNECVFCGSEFVSVDSLRLHLHDHHDIQFENSVERRRRKQEPCGEQESKPVTCSTCGVVFPSAGQLKQHVVEEHCAEGPVQCPECPKVFPRKLNLHNHYKRRHLHMFKHFVCSFCGLALKGKSALRSHEDRVHRNIRPFQCPDCPEAFTTLEVLRKHSQRHMAERPMLHCPHCDKKFTTASGFERHVKTHEGVKDHTCDVMSCGKAFYTKFELRRHMKFHTRDFRHVCEVCGHRFMAPGELRKHATKHTGDRPYKCHLCSAVYSRRDDKVKHLKRVHNLKVKRVYGKPLRRFADHPEELDTIEIDEGGGDREPPKYIVLGGGNPPA